MIWLAGIWSCEIQVMFVFRFAVQQSQTVYLNGPNLPSAPKAPAVFQLFFMTYCLCWCSDIPISMSALGKTLYPQSNISIISPGVLSRAWVTLCVKLCMLSLHWYVFLTTSMPQYFQLFCLGYCLC